MKNKLLIKIMVGISLIFLSGFLCEGVSAETRSVNFGWNSGYSFDDTYSATVPSDYYGCKVKIAPHEGTGEYCDTSCDISIIIGGCTDSYECIVDANPGGTIDITFSPSSWCDGCLWDYDIYKYAWCGDGKQGTYSGYRLGTCVNGEITSENCESCPEDYPTSSGEVCCSGNIFNGDCCSDSDCNSDYTCESYDCTASAPSSYCGDGTCDSDETCSSCSGDCGACSPSSYCGDGTCDSDETCSSCSDDCGACNGEYCSSNSNCESGNCENNLCCLTGKTCCTSNANCLSDYECGASNYCIESSSEALKDNGYYCSSNSQCSSANCQNGICCISGETCCQYTSNCGDGFVCDTDYYYCKSTMKSNGESCSFDSDCSSNNCNLGGYEGYGSGGGYCCESGKDCCYQESDCSEGYRCHSNYYCVKKITEVTSTTETSDEDEVQTYTYKAESSSEQTVTQSTTKKEEWSLLCDLGEGSSRNYVDCYATLLAELNIVADVAENAVDFYCDVIRELVNAIDNLDVTNTNSINAARKKINAATAKLFLILVDLGDNAFVVAKVLNVFECFEDYFGVFGRILDYIVEGIVIGLFEETGESSASIVSHSPVNILIEHENGKSLGKDENGIFHDELEGSYKFYSKSAVEVAIAIGVDPEKVEYKITGTGSGTADITIIEIDKKGNKEYKEFNDIAVDKGTDLKISSDKSGKTFLEEYKDSEIKIIKQQPDVINIGKLSKSKAGLSSSKGTIIGIIILVLSVIGVLGFFGYKKKDLILSKIKGISSKKKSSRVSKSVSSNKSKKL
ncbi:hypothetical protein GOV14_05845 [Candidatus Pacearchaeota archaeon]|nr:hypothetical protein [Candidatus Pacearchaeota archaeon]